MFGREREPIDWGPFLWPPLIFCLKTQRPLAFVLLIIAFLLIKAALKWCHSWWWHWKLAAAIADWHTAELKVKLKLKRWRPRRTPHPLRLFALPAVWMVLSAVMLPATAAHFLVPVVAPPVPATWIETTAAIRSLDPPRRWPRLPPDKIASLAMERERKKVWKRLVNCLQIQETNEVEDDLELDDWDSFMITTGCSPAVCQTLHEWSDFPTHVAAFVAESFGPIGLLSASPIDMIAIVDTGASICVSPFREDFVTYEPMTGTVIKGLSKGANIAGRGTLVWNVDVGGTMVELHLRAVHVPAASQRLLCPQQLHQEWCPSMRKSELDGDSIELHFPQGDVPCPFNESNLPELKLCSPKEFKSSIEALNSCLLKEHNHNLKPAQKELLRWHWKFGHLNLAQTQQILRSGVCGHSPLTKAAASLNLSQLRPLCGSCLHGKAKRRRSKLDKADGSAPSPTYKEKLLSKDTLIPGEKVSMDHFVVSTPGRLFSSRGRERTDQAYKGGVIFVDHASGFVWVVPVVNFTAGEALRAKREFESEMMSMGVTVLRYHTDNGVFTAAEFQDSLAESQQTITFSGVGAHHQNSTAERAIGTVTGMCRTMMLHAKMRWPKAVTASLWPMAMKHAQHLMNHLPVNNNMCALDLVLKTTVPRHALRNLHVWGAPCYVLDPRLQDGHKIPKFDPRSRRGMHLGKSPQHASTVPLVLNLSTGNVSPQFHVVFDDWFSTVNTSELNPDDSLDDESWQELFSNERFLAHFDDEDPVDLDDEWLTELERIERHDKTVSRVQANMPAEPVVPADLPRVSPKTPTIQEKPAPQPPAGPPEGVVPKERPVSLDPKAPSIVRGSPQPARGRPSTVVPPRGSSINAPPVKRELRSSSKITRSGRAYPARVRGLFNTLTCFAAVLCKEPVMSLAKEFVGAPAAHAALAGFDAVTATYDSVDFMSFQAATKAKSKSKKGDPDFPTYWEAMAGPEADEWKDAMRKEIETLMNLGSWEMVPREAIEKLGHKIIKSTWALRVKRSPDGNPLKKKARWCVRGDHQNKLAAEGGLDPFETYSPVVQWSSVRLMLILSIVHNLETRQVDYVNAFAQAELNKPVFVEPPAGFKHNNPFPVVLRLKKSLYGMSDAPLIFFELLRDNLIAIGFEQWKNIDPCLFVHKKAICLTYVDDCLWFGKDGAAIDKLIKRMKDERKMDLTVESNDVSAFLGIQFTRRGSTIELQQLGLIDRIIQDTGMEDANAVSTPAEPKALGKDPEGKPYEEAWNYRSIIGKLLYLSGNSRPDIAFAVHQAARFSHDPKQSHAKAVKRIIRYLIGTRNRGLVMRPTNDWKIDCHVDADFCGLWGSEDPDDPIVSKSRTGFVITLAGCPLLWTSKLQPETSVSTMMAEYVALSSVMREMLPLKRMVKAIAKTVTGNDDVQMNCVSDVWEDNNGALQVATTPKITPQSKFFAVKLHFFKEHVKTPQNPTGEVNIQKIETTAQIADLMTKGLVEAKFVPLRDKLMGWDLDPNGPPKLHLHSDANFAATLGAAHSRGSVGSATGNVENGSATDNVENANVESATNHGAHFALSPISPAPPMATVGDASAPPVATHGDITRIKSSRKPNSSIN